MIQPSIKQTFNLAASTKLYRVDDITDYTIFGLLPSQVKGILTTESPIGVFYSNTNFATPDITPGTTDFAEIQIPVNSDATHINGIYTTTYNTQYTFAITAVTTGANGSFTIAGDFTADFFSGKTFEINGSTGNDGTYTVISSTLNSGDTVIVVANVADGTVDGDVLLENTLTQQYELQFGSGPTVSITQTANCNCAEFTSVDTTSYTVSAQNYYTALSPTVTSRTHTVKYPAGIVPPIADVVSSSATIKLTNLYTTTYWSLIETALTYVLPTIGNPTVLWTAKKSCSYDVVCNLSICTVSSCMKKLYSAWLQALQTGHVQKEKLETKLLSAAGAFVLYSLAAKCGDEETAEQAVKELSHIADSAGCGCGCTSDNCDPVEILPLCNTGSGSGGTTVVQSLLNGITITSTTVGSTTTYTLGLNYALLGLNLAATNGQVVAGVLSATFVSPSSLKFWWESGLVGNSKVVVTDSNGKFIGQNIGTAHNKNFGTGVNNIAEIGATLVAGRDVITDATGKLITIPRPYEMLVNNYTPATTSSTGQTVLRTVNIPANFLIANGNYLKITLDIEAYGPTLADQQARLFFGSSNYVLSFPGSTGGLGSIKHIEAYFTRTGAATQVLQLIQHTNTIPNSTYQSPLTPFTVDLTNSFNIDVTGQSASGTGVITVLGFRVEVFR